MLGFCEDAEVVGTPFYVMAHVEGRIFWDPTLPELTRAERAALYDDVNRVIAKLHDVDYTAVGLRDYGRAGHYLERQIARWSKQYVASRTLPIEAMDQLIDWLPKRLPPAGTTSIVHGDLRLDNMIFHPSEPHCSLSSTGSCRLSAIFLPTSDITCLRGSYARRSFGAWRVPISRRSAFQPRTFI